MRYLYFIEADESKINEGDRTMQEIEVKEMLRSVLSDLTKELTTKQWMTLKEGAAYAGVSYNTFMKFRIRGLKICEIDGVRRISKKEIDNFLNENSI